MTAVLYYHPEAYSISGEKLMGRHSAGESFLQAYLKYSSDENIAVYCDLEDHRKSFLSCRENIASKKNVTFLDRTSLTRLENFGCIYYPSPSLSELARKRSLFSNAAWSLSGVTHTTSSATVMDSITGYLTEPIQPWDALICTSSAVRNNVVTLLDSQEEYLIDRLGAKYLPRPMLPIIPLGIHTDRFIYTESERISSRHRLEISNDSIAVLYVGRLSFHAKANPFAMYQALEIATKRTQKSVVLIECGWHANQSIEAAFSAARLQISPSLRYIYLDGRTKQNRDLAWASADIFCSFSDNIQETFGLSPLEAMAAGLPVVASEWNGYRDTIRHGVDGFLAKTMMPPAGLGKDFALRYALDIDTYDRYCGYSSGFVSVDVLGAADAFQSLFLFPELRRKMGDSGRSRARLTYDWKAVFPLYEDLWAELSRIRNAHKAKKIPSRSDSTWPARQDPYKIFSVYPSSQLKLDTQLSLVAGNAEESINHLASYRRLSVINYVDAVVANIEELKFLLRKIGTKNSGVRTREILEVLPQERRAIGLRSLVFLCKMNLLKVE